MQREKREGGGEEGKREKGGGSEGGWSRKQWTREEGRGWNRRGEEGGGENNFKQIYKDTNWSLITLYTRKWHSTPQLFISSVKTQSQVQMHWVAHMCGNSSTLSGNEDWASEEQSNTCRRGGGRVPVCRLSGATPHLPSGQFQREDLSPALFSFPLQPCSCFSSPIHDNILKITMFSPPSQNECPLPQKCHKGEWSPDSRGNQLAIF